MRLANLTKPVEVDLPLQIDTDAEAFRAQRKDALNLTTLPDIEVEVEEDDNFEQQLVVAVDYIRKMQNYLGFIYQNNSQHQWLGEKAEENLQELVEEVEDFLGDYST